MSTSMTLQKNLYVYYQEILTECLKTFRMLDFVIPAFLFPVMFYIFFAVVFKQGPKMPGYLLATYSVFGVIGPALFSFGVGVAVEKQQGWLAYKQISPMPISAYFAAKMVASLGFALVILLELFIVGAIFGEVALTRYQWVSTLLLCLIGCLPFCAIGLWLGLSLRGQSAPVVVNLIYLPMAFLSGLWIPINLFPSLMEKIAFLFPAFHLAQLVLSVQNYDLGYSSWIHVSILIIITVVFLLLAGRAFTRINEK